MSNLFKSGDTVRVKDNGEVVQVVGDPRLLRGEYWYVVAGVGGKKRVAENAIELPASPDADLASLAQQGKWGRLQAVRCALGLERINNKNESTIYSYQAQRIIFQAHQYKPLLKLLDTTDKRLLIADEVGVGKTIEAGIILTELQARSSMDRVLVVCPSRLRQKWANELNRKFDQDFEIFDGKGFCEKVSQIADKPNRNRLHGIVSTQTLRSPKCREALTSSLGYLDLVIMDEAHHARNRQTSTSKLLRDLCEIGAAVVLLSATPVQLKNEDLFTLLNALRPTEFSDAFTFENDMLHFSPIHLAASMVRTRKPEHLPDVANRLRDVFKGAAANDPLAERVIKSCGEIIERDRSDWLDLEHSIRELHPLGSIIARTRKREVDQKAPVRRARTVVCDFTSEEDEAYRRVVQGTNNRGWANRSLTLPEVQRSRQAASCLPAACFATQTLLDDDQSDESSDLLPSEIKNLGVLQGTKNVSLDAEVEWSGTDSKLAKLIELLDELWQNEPNAKVIVFAFFKGTVRYLEEQLNRRGYKATRIDGDIVSDPKNPDKDHRGQRIRDFENDPRLNVLLSTEVGSEGLDFQFCHVIINYDLPWNPMVLEQRIGRVDRFGQKSDVVLIVNLVVRGTIEDLILSRLYERIKIFEGSLGHAEAILGRTMIDLQKSFVRGELSIDEASVRVEQEADVIINEQKSLEKLQDEASELIGHEDHIRDEIHRIQRLGRYVIDQSILAIITTYFESNHPRIRIQKNSNGSFAFRLTDALKKDIHRANLGSGFWADRSIKGVLSATTSGEVAFHNRDLELIHASHPLMKAAVRALAQQMEDCTARIGAGSVMLSTEDEGIANGAYTIALFAIEVSGVRRRRVLKPICWHNNERIVIDSNEAERLLFLAMERGEEIDDRDELPPLTAEGWDSIENTLFESLADLQEKEQIENQARFARRRRSLDAEFQHKLSVKKQRLKTAKANKNKSILPALQGQIDKANAEYEKRVAELEEMKQVQVSASDPLAICVLEVRRQ